MTIVGAAFWSVLKLFAIERIHSVYLQSHIHAWLVSPELDLTDNTSANILAVLTRVTNHHAEQDVLADVLLQSLWDLQDQL